MLGKRDSGKEGGRVRLIELYLTKQRPISIAAAAGVMATFTAATAPCYTVFYKNEDTTLTAVPCDFLTNFLRILSLTDSAVNLQYSDNKTSHYTSNVLLHYLVKYQRQKTTI